MLKNNDLSLNKLMPLEIKLEETYLLRKERKKEKNVEKNAVRKRSAIE